MKRALYLLLALFAVSLSLSSCAGDNLADNTTILWKEIESIPDKEGFSATYAGTHNGTLIVTGGCNFPDKPVYQGGKKVYNDKIFLFKDGTWTISPATLPTPSAYGVSITIPKGLIIIGGSDGTQSLNQSYILTGDSITPLAPLPIPLDNMAGALVGKDIYIAAGSSNGTPSNRAFRYNIDKNIWSEIAPYPGQARLQPIAAGQNSAEESRLYLFSGFNPETALVMTDGYYYSPREEKWYPTTASPITFTGGVAVSTGVHAIITTTGVNRELFEQGLRITDDSTRIAYQTHPPEWYKFNRELMFYNTIVDRWAPTGTLPEGAGRAGASLVPDGKGWYLIMGEVKPGVRTNKVLYGSLQSEKSFGFLNWSVIIVYLIGMLLLGYFFMRRNKNSDDFFKAGGRIPWWAVSISIFATMLSAITFMSIPAKTYATNWVYFPMALTIFMVAFPIVKYYLPFFRRLNITSAYEYLELRFNSTTRIMASLLFIVFMTARMALVLYLPSLALTTATGIDIYTCILLMSVITIIYSSMGGVEAVVWGDVVQGIILTGGAIFTLIYLITHTDGNFIQIAMTDEKMKMFDWSLDFSKATIWVVLLGGIANQFISYGSDQTVIQRYMTVKNEKSAAKSIITNGVLSVFSSLLFYLIGTGLYTYFQTRPETLDFSTPTADSIFPFFIMNQLPAGVAGLMIAAIFAASMSTVSSNINSISTAFTVDIYSKLAPRATDKGKLYSARASSIVFGVLGTLFALLMATWNILSLFDWFNTMLALLTSGLGALFFIGIFFDRIKGRAALVGFILGTAGVILVSAYSDLFFLMYGVIGMGLTIISSLILSYIIPEKGHNLKGLTWKKLNK